MLMTLNDSFLPPLAKIPSLPLRVAGLREDLLAPWPGCSRSCTWRPPTLSSQALNVGSAMPLWLAPGSSPYSPMLATLFRSIA